MLKTQSIGTALTILGFLLGTVGAQAADDRVGKLLKQAGLEYEIDKDGDYLVVYAFDDGRAQVVFINSEATKYETLEMREVWSVAVASKDTVSVDLARRLLKENGEVLLGSWRTLQDGDDHIIVFGAPVSIDISAANLAQVMHDVAVVADDMEKEQTGKDEY